MKFYLCQSAPISASDPSGTARYSIRFTVEIDPSPIPDSDENSEVTELCSKLRKLLNFQQLETGFTGSTISFELRGTPDENEVEWYEVFATAGLSVIEGPEIKALIDLCGPDLKVQLSFANLQPNSAGLEHFRELKLNNGGKLGCELVLLDKFDHEMWNLFNGSNLRGELTMTVICDDTFVSGPVVTDKMQVNRRMLVEGIHSDIVIIAENGKEIISHKAVLAAHSDVFMAMLQTEMTEAKTHKVEMPDMSEEGVRALLAYLYCWDEVEPNAKPVVAFELLHAGHKYNIPVLETAMKKLLLAKPEARYDVDVAMKLFLLARNLPEDGHPLKMKAVKVIKMNFGNVKKSPTYVNLLTESPAAAKELCDYAFGIV